jgi:hypothetical protein
MKSVPRDRDLSAAGTLGVLRNVVSHSSHAARTPLTGTHGYSEPALEKSRT